MLYLNIVRGIIATGRIAISSEVILPTDKEYKDEANVLVNKFSIFPRICDKEDSLVKVVVKLDLEENVDVIETIPYSVAIDFAARVKKSSSATMGYYDENLKKLIELRLDQNLASETRKDKQKKIDDLKSLL